MVVRPGLEEVRAIAAQGRYKVLPVSCEMLSDICTPIEAMKILKNVSTHCFLLESVVEREKWGRYTFLGFEPKMEITCTGGEMKAAMSEYLSVLYDLAPESVGGALPGDDFYYGA